MGWLLVCVCLFAVVSINLLFFFFVWFVRSCVCFVGVFLVFLFVLSLCLFAVARLLVCVDCSLVFVNVC